MSGKIAIEKLKPHPKNSYYFTDVDGEKYEEIKRSIATYGVRDPLKVTTSYTVVSGHQRLRIAKELGFTEIPVEIVDVDEWQAEYLLIAENVERRGQAESDPIKKARIAQFLKEYWGVKDVGNNRKYDGQNVQQKTMDDVGESVGTSAKGAQRLLKLNDLIPEIQSLVSSGKLGTTAAEQLAYLSEEEQRALFEDRGDDVAEITVAEAKELRQKLAEKQAEIVRLQNDLEKAQREAIKPPKVIEKEVVKEVIPQDVRRKIAEIERENKEMEASLRESYARIRELERLERSVKNEVENPLYDIYRSLSGTIGHLQAFTEGERFAREVIANADTHLTDKLIAEIKLAMSLMTTMLSLIQDETTVVVEDVSSSDNEQKLIEVVE